MHITTIVIVLISALTFGTNTAVADTEPQSPEEYCWEQQAAFIDEGVEIPTGPIETSGERWTIVWESGSEDIIPGHQISVPFADGVVLISGNTPAMADHLLTLNAHWAAGREPFAVRYEGTVFMIVPHWNNDTQESWCLSLPMTP
jgi:hypothetical protein